MFLEIFPIVSCLISWWNKNFQLCRHFAFINDLIVGCILQRVLSMGTSSLFDGVKHRSEIVNPSLAIHDALVNAFRPSINCITRVRPKSPPKVRASTPQHQHRLRQFAGQRVAHERVQLQYNNSHRIVSHDKVRESRLCMVYSFFKIKFQLQSKHLSSTEKFQFQLFKLFIQTICLDSGGK